MQIDLEKNYTATIETARGNIEIEFYPQHAPKTVNNFVFLAREGFYDGVVFHRVVDNFVIQGGDPTGTGRGGPGYRFEDECAGNPHKHGTGTLSMANAGPNTNGSQFFITYGATPWLDAYDANGNLRDCARRDVSCHAVFGRVIEGMDVLKSLAPRDPAQAASPGDPIKTISIKER